VGGLRFEWFRDNNGYRVFNPIRNAISGGAFGDTWNAGDAGNFWQMTWGLNDKPNRNIIVRPELRVPLALARQHGRPAALRSQLRPGVRSVLRRLRRDLAVRACLAGGAIHGRGLRQPRAQTSCARAGSGGPPRPPVSDVKNAGARRQRWAPFPLVAHAGRVPCGFRAQKPFFSGASCDRKSSHEHQHRKSGKGKIICITCKDLQVWLPGLAFWSSWTLRSLAGRNPAHPMQKGVGWWQARRHLDDA